MGIDAAKLASESHVDYVKAESDVMPKLASGSINLRVFCRHPIRGGWHRLPQRDKECRRKAPSFSKIQSGVVFSPLS